MISTTSEIVFSYNKINENNTSDHELYSIIQVFILFSTRR